MTTTYERNDTVRGIITNTSSTGCYVRIENAEPDCPNAYYKGCGRAGDRVMLSVIRVFDNQILTKLDSVLEYAA